MPISSRHAIRTGRTSFALAIAAEAQELDAQTLENVQQVLSDYERAIDRYRREAFELDARGQAVDWAVVDMSLTQLSRTAHENLRALLGDKRYERVKTSELFALAPNVPPTEQMQTVKAALAERIPPAQRVYSRSG